MKWILLASTLLFYSISPAQIGGRSYKYHLELVKPEGSSGLSYEDSLMAIVFQFSQTQINFVLRNRSRDVLKLVWDEVVLVQNGITGKLMHKGVKYIDRNASTPPSIIPPGAILDDLLAPTENVWYSSSSYVGGWKQTDLFPSNDRNKEKLRNAIMSQIGNEISIFMPFKNQVGKDIPYNFVFRIADITCTNCKRKEKERKPSATSSVYIDINGFGGGNENILSVGGGTLSLGKLVSGFSFGVGSGVLLIHVDDDKDTDPYIPVFGQIGYIGNKSKLSPYITGQLGYGFYNVPGSTFDKDGIIKGNIYSQVKAGLSYAVGKEKNRVYGFGGLMPLTFVRKNGSRQKTFDEMIFMGGIGMLFAKK